MPGLIERTAAKFKNLPPRFKAVAVVAGVAWAARTALWPIGGYDLYQQVQAMDHVSLSDVFNHPALSGRAATYGLAWLFLKAVHWTCAGYIIYGYYRSPSYRPPEAPPAP